MTPEVVSPSLSFEEIERITDPLYDVVFGYRPDVAFYLEVARRYGGPILEAGCGTGRIAVPLAGAGYSVVGFDRSESRLAAFRRRLDQSARAIQARVRILCADMRAPSLGDERFATIIMPFRSFQHLLTPDDQHAALVALGSYLAPGGRVLIDIFNPSIPLLADDALLDDFGDTPLVELPNGRKVALRGRIVRRDYLSQTLSAEEIYLVVERDGRRTRYARPYVSRYTFRYELEHLAHRAGFEMEELWGDYDFTPYGQVQYPGELLMLLRRAPCS